jgi:hypothetical protein
MYLTETNSTALLLAGEENNRFRRLLKLTPAFQLLGRGDEAREAAELCVRGKFHSAYGAELDTFLPYMLTMHCAGRLTGVSGINPAAKGPLFLEQYLAEPLESRIGKITGQTADRAAIVEIGNLVSASNGGSLAIFIVLASALAACGYEHMVFTATRKLRHRFTRLGFDFQHLADANLDCLPDSSAGNWGSYYDNNPQVVLGSATQAVELIESRALFSCVSKTLSGEIDRVAAQLLRTRTAL